MKVVVEQRSVYGSIKFYPLNLLAQQFVDLMRKKTFDALDLRSIKTMGIEVVVSSDLVKI